jgi:hypothetical protein
MLKTIMIAGALVLGLLGMSPVGPARAGTTVDIGIGPGGGYDPGPYYWPARRGISCRQGLRIVASAGFRRVRPIDCNGSEYAYLGRRHQGWFKITLKSSNGRIKDVDRFRRGGGGYDDGNDYDDGDDDGGGYDDGGYDDEY